MKQKTRNFKRSYKHLEATRQRKELKFRLNISNDYELKNKTEQNNWRENKENLREIKVRD